jgi:hypothetical protein
LQDTTERRINVGQKDFFHHLVQISHNVPAVYDVFLRPIRKNAKHFYGRKKMWRRKNAQRGEAPTGILRSLAAVRRRTVTDLLRLQKNYFLLKNTLKFAQKSLKNA